MRNLYDFVKGNIAFSQFHVGDVVCAEYYCHVEEKKVAIYTHCDYLVHVLSGKKTWTTIEGEWEMEAGQTLFVKKGVSFVTQDFSEEFCMLSFFLPDDIIRETLTTMDLKFQPIESDVLFTATRVTTDSRLKNFFDSTLPYFGAATKPSEPIVRLKIMELLHTILSEGQSENLLNHLYQVAHHTKPQLAQIMEANYRYNLKLHEYAKMTHRSLSSFRRDFLAHYNTAPGKWLLEKRLKFAADLLLQGESRIAEVAYESGFESAAHFSRAFKKQYNTSPSGFLAHTAK